MTLALTNTALLAATFIAALVAVVLAWLAHRRTRSIVNELDSLARVLDQVMRESARRRRDDLATMDQLNRSVSEEIGLLASRIGRPGDGLEDERPPRSDGAGMAAGQGETDRGGAEDRLAAALKAGRMELSLQPIVSIDRGEAVAFEAFACVLLDDERQVDIRRPGPSNSFDVLSFEKALLSGAVATARRRLGAASEQMPVHVAVSGALLDDADAVAEFAETVGLHPGVARSVVLSVPDEALKGPGRAEALRGLADAGVRFAIEGWREAPAGLPAPDFVKIEVARLLGAASRRSRATSGRKLVEAVTATGARIVACDVTRDEEAVNLIDLGVDLMMGERFSRPRRLKPEDGPGAAADAPTP